MENEEEEEKSGRRRGGRNRAPERRGEEEEAAEEESSGKGSVWSSVATAAADRQPGTETQGYRIAARGGESLR